MARAHSWISRTGWGGVPFRGGGRGTYIRVCTDRTGFQTLRIADLALCMYVVANHHITRKLGGGGNDMTPAPRPEGTIKRELRGESGEARVCFGRWRLAAAQGGGGGVRRAVLSWALVRGLGRGRGTTLSHFGKNMKRRGLQYVSSHNRLLRLFEQKEPVLETPPLDSGSWLRFEGGGGGVWCFFLMICTMRHITDLSIRT
jgi:hypothetical protein